MSKNKKPKKAYTPRPVRHPQLIVALYSFDPFIQAIEAILTSSEYEVDQTDQAIYLDFAGKAHSVTGTLNVYMDYVSLYKERQGKTLSFPNLVQFRDTIHRHGPLDEALLEAVKTELQLCKQIASIIPVKDSQDLMYTIKSRNELKKLNKAEKDLKSLTHMVVDRQQILEFIERAIQHYEWSRQAFVVGGDAAAVLQGALKTCTRIDLYLEPALYDTLSLLKNEWSMVQVKDYTMLQQHKYYLHRGLLPLGAVSHLAPISMDTLQVLAPHVLLTGKVHPLHQYAKQTQNNLVSMTPALWTKNHIQRALSDEKPSAIGINASTYLF